MNLTPSSANLPSTVTISMPRIDLVAVLIRHRRTMLVAFLSVVLLGVAYIAVATPKYESTAQLIIKFGDRAVPDVDRSPVTELTPADRREVVLTNAAILESPDLVQTTVEAIGIKTLYPDILENPPQGWTPLNEATRRFADNLWVGVGTQSNVITVSFLHPDAEVAQQAMKQLIDLYTTRQTAVYRSSFSDFLKTEMDEAYRRLEKAQSALGAFKEQYGISNYDQEINELLKQRGEINASLYQAQAAYDQAKERRDELAELIKSVPTTQPVAAGGELYRALDEAQARLAELEAKRSQMLATYDPNSPALAAVDAAILTASKEVTARRSEVEQRSSVNVNTVHQAVQTDYLRTVAEAESSVEPVRVLTGQLDAINQRLEVIEKARGSFLDLTREERLAEETYRSRFARHEDARVKDNLNRQRISAATTISGPNLPYRPARPRTAITLLICVFAGIIFAIGAALALQAWRNDFMTPEQLTTFLGIPVLAAIPGPRHRKGLLFTPRGSQ